MAHRLLIAGAGIGGMSAALACAREGNSVVVLEQASAWQPVGAGIQLGPNVTRLLQAWGLNDGLNAIAARPQNLHVRDAQRASVCGQMRLGNDFLLRYGAPYLTVHRADLQALLANTLAVTPGVQLTLGAEVQNFTQSPGAVQISVQHSDTQTLPTAVPTAVQMEAQALVAADGLWSRVREGMLHDGMPLSTGHTAYRALLKQSDLPKNLRNQDVTAWLGLHMHVVHYPVCRGEWLNIAVFLESPKSLGASGWHAGGDPEVLRSSTLNCHASLQNLLQAAGDWGIWSLHTRPAVRGPEEMAQGRVALLGDAAHPMLPYLAQGAGMAIEDAACLAQSLGVGGDLPAALQAYANARWRRNARVQIRAARNSHLFHAKGLVRWGRNWLMQGLGRHVLDVPWLYRH